MKIKIATFHDGMQEVEGEPTAVPELFVTPAFYGTDSDFTPEDAFVLSHVRTGIKVGSVYSKADCFRLAELFAESGIPWSQLKTADDAKPWGERYRAVMIKFEAGV